MNPSKIDSQIIDEIVKAIQVLGGDMELTATIASWGDTLEDTEILSLLRSWNQRSASRAGHGRN